MSSIVTGSAHHGGLPAESGYTHGFALLAAAALAATVAALLVPRTLRGHHAIPSEPSIPHAELGMIAAGTLIGDEPE